MPKIIRIAKDTLQNFYLAQKLSSYQIANFFGCSQALIMNKLKEYKIPRRSIQEAKSLTKPKYNRKNFCGDLSEKAYLIGFRVGDLYVTKTHPKSPTIRISTNTTKEAQLKLISRLFVPYGHVRIAGPDSRGAKSIRCFVNNSFNFLLKKEDIIETWILKKRKYFRSFLAGYTDAEGTFCICKGQGVFELKSQDKNILQAIQKKLNDIGVLCNAAIITRRSGDVDKRGIRNNKDVWGLFIYRKSSLLRLIKLLNPFVKHAERLRNMHEVKTNIQERNLKYGK